jgi:hypothetical protein
MQVLPFRELPDSTASVIQLMDASDLYVERRVIATANGGCISTPDDGEECSGFNKVCIAPLVFKGWLQEGGGGNTSSSGLAIDAGDFSQSLHKLPGVSAWAVCVIDGACLDPDNRNASELLMASGCYKGWGQPSTGLQV